MRYKIYGLALIILGVLAAGASAQPCLSISASVVVKDESFNAIGNARVEAIRLFGDGTRDLFTASETAENGVHRLVFQLPGPSQYFEEDFLIRVSAGGFRAAELKVHLHGCRNRSYEAVLTPAESEREGAVTEMIAMLGKVVDATGREVADVLVRAEGEDGRVYEVRTDEFGLYMLDVCAGVYTIRVESGRESYRYGPIKVASKRSLGFFNMRLGFENRVASL